VLFLSVHGFFYDNMINNVKLLMWISSDIDKKYEGHARKKWYPL